MKNLFVGVVFSFVLVGCAPLIIGAGGSASYVAVQERGFKEVGEDLTLKTKLVNQLTRLNANYLKDLSINVHQRDVLITGVVQEKNEMQAIEQRARSVDGTERVVVALQLKPYPFKQYMKDVATSTNLRTRLIMAKDVYTANYNITLVKGEVYLFGWAYTQQEVGAAVHTARTTRGVDKVHNYLRVMPNGAEKLRQIERQRKAYPDSSHGVDQVN